MELPVTKVERAPATAMAREIREIPAAAQRLLARQAVVSAIADRIHAAAPRVVVTCGRGSSGHVGVYLRYLFEARIGLLVSAAAPLFLRSRRCLTPQALAISMLAIAAMGTALLANLYPAPPPPYSTLPYLYAGLLAGGFAWSTFWNARSPALDPEIRAYADI